MFSVRGVVAYIVCCFSFYSCKQKVSQEDRVSMFERIKNLVIKEFIYYFREKRTVFFLFATPLIQIIVFGYVATMDVNNVSTALYDLDRSSESRELTRRLESSGYFTIKRLPESPGK